MFYSSNNLSFLHHHHDYHQWCPFHYEIKNQHSGLYVSVSVTPVNKQHPIYTMEYYSAVKKNSFESVLMRWIKLEPIIQSEVSQKDNDQYSILTHIYGI